MITASYISLRETLRPAARMWLRFGAGVSAIAVASGAAGLAAQDIPDIPDLQDASPVYGPPVQIAPQRGLPAPPAIPDALDMAAMLAAATHPLVQATEAESRALDAEFRGARRGRFPSLSVEALAATSGSSFADEDGLALNATLEQPVWTGGRIGGAIDRARASRDAGENRVTQARRRIVDSVIRAYYDYLQADERLDVLQDSLRQHNDLLGSIERRVRQEVSPMIDLTLGRSRTAQVELDLTSARELRETARLRLVELTGGAQVIPVLPPAGTDAVLPPEDIALNEALTCDPSLAVLTNLVAVAQAQRDIADAQLLPQLLLQLQQNEITGTRAAVVLRMRLNNGLSETTAIESANARIQRAVAEFAETQRNQREDLRREYIQIRAASGRIAAGTIAADAADRIIASYQRQFIAGRRSWLDVMNAVREAAGARLTQSDAQVAAARGTARVLALTCRWQPGDTPPRPAPQMTPQMTPQLIQPMTQPMTGPSR